MCFLVSRVEQEEHCGHFEGLVHAAGWLVSCLVHVMWSVGAC